jgi:hypothetical protein
MKGLRNENKLSNEAERDVRKFAKPKYMYFSLHNLRENSPVFYSSSTQDTRYKLYLSPSYKFF